MKKAAGATRQSKVGFIALGDIGFPMAGNLLKAGSRLHGHDPRRLGLPWQPLCSGFIPSFYCNALQFLHRQATGPGLVPTPGGSLP